MEKQSVKEKRKTFTNGTNEKNTKIHTNITSTYLLGVRGSGCNGGVAAVQRMWLVHPRLLHSTQGNEYILICRI